MCWHARLLSHCLDERSVLFAPPSCRGEHSQLRSRSTGCVALSRHSTKKRTGEDKNPRLCDPLVPPGTCTQVPHKRVPSETRCPHPTRGNEFLLFPALPSSPHSTACAEGRAGSARCTPDRDHERQRPGGDDQRATGERAASGSVLRSTAMSYGYEAFLFIVARNSAFVRVLAIRASTSSVPSFSPSILTIRRSVQTWRSISDERSSSSRRVLLR